MALRKACEEIRGLSPRLGGVPSHSFRDLENELYWGA